MQRKCKHLVEMSSLVRRNPVAPCAWRAKGGQHADRRFSSKQKARWRKEMRALAGSQFF